MVNVLTPENTGCSQMACNVVNNTFLSLDGFAELRRIMDESEYQAAHFGGELARIVDREIFNSVELSMSDAESFCYQLLDESGYSTSGNGSSQIVYTVILDLYELDRYAKIARSKIRDTLNRVLSI